MGVDDLDDFGALDGEVGEVGGDLGGGDEVGGGDGEAGTPSMERSNSRRMRVPPGATAEAAASRRWSRPGPRGGRAQEE